jgi:hypothetical protein
MVDKKRDLARLIVRALALADELELPIVGAKLDEAAQALKESQDEPAALLQVQGLIRVLANTGPKRSRSGANVVELHPPTSLERLMSDHKVLDNRRKSLLKLTEGRPKPIEASKLVVEFGALIQAHRAVERSCVYGPLMAKGIDAGQDLGVKLGGLVEEIETDWESYLRNWDQGTIGNEWGDFTFATQSTLSRAGERMRLEEQIIYPLAFVSGLIRFGGSAG